MHPFKHAQPHSRVEHRALLLVCAVFALFHANLALANPSERSQSASRSPFQAASGTLFFPSEDGQEYLSAPVLDTTVDLKITGLICRATVRQRFHNPTADWVEGMYVFPLPEMAAVDGMTLVVGDRLIEGQIQPKEQARETYETARSEGRKASLLEQERPNIFTTSVANIGPGEEVSVSISYQQTLRFDAGGFRLRFPMVVAPRYAPGESMLEAIAAPDSITLDSFSQMLHGQRPGPVWLESWLERVDALPAVAPRVSADDDPMHRVRIGVSLDAGFPIENLSSPSHAFTFEAPEPSVRRIELLAYADRDFVLKWRLAGAAQPRAAIFAEQSRDATTVLLMLVPPTQEFEPEALQREVVFVIDTSGSMGGASIRQARAALQLALERLAPTDWFNVIAFDSTTRALFPESQPARSNQLDRAKDFVASLEATGGTEMLSAIDLALRSSEGKGSQSTQQDRVRQVIFITDGSISNETELFETVHQKLGPSRLFAVGIGSAPNGFFLERIAKFGRGTYTYIATPAEVEEQMGGLFAKLERPALRDVAIHWNDDVEMWPERVPDLYLGEPLVVTARVPRVVGDVVVSGRIGDRSWESRLPFRPDAIENGIGKLWARSKIAALMDSASAGASRDAVRDAVTRVALEHHLVSKFTSLVAVDVPPTRPIGRAAQRAHLPLNHPRGWKRPAMGMPRTATPASLLLMIGVVSLAAAGVVAKRQS